MVKYIPYKQLFIYYKSRKNEGVHMEINIGIIAIIVLAIAILAILASGYVKASPNKAYIISGIKREPKVLIGRAGIKIPFLEKKDELILKQISIDIKTNGIYLPRISSVWISTRGKGQSPDPERCHRKCEG